MARVVTCPQCGNLSVYSPANAFRPFCSERCRLIDLGAWAEGSYRIAGGEVDAMDNQDAGEEKPDDIREA